MFRYLEGCLRHYLLFVLGGFSVLKSLNIGLLVTLRLSLIIVAAAIGLELGFIS